MEVRCRSRMHFVVVDGYYEVKCKSKHCGAGNGRVVIHRFDQATGNLIKTERFKDPRILFTRTGKE